MGMGRLVRHSSYSSHRSYSSHWLWLIACLFLTPAASAQTFEVGVQHVATVMTGDTGELDVPLGRGFSATGEAFWSPRLSTQLAATFVNPEAILFPSSGGDVDLGTLGVTTYALSARWHFVPEARLSGFVGGGAAYVELGNLDDQFGDAVEADYDPQTTFLVEGGLRYRFRPRLIINLTATYMPLSAETNVRKPHASLPAELELNPVTVGLGAAWRF